MISWLSLYKKSAIFAMACGAVTVLLGILAMFGAWQSMTAVGAVSRISAKDYILANLIGKFPSTALEVVIGHDIVNFQQHSQRLAVLVVVVGLVFWGYKKHRDKKKA